MYIITEPDLEPRLQKRYRLLVQQHLAKAESIATGLRHPPRTGSVFAAAQAAWRFYDNTALTLPCLAAPLLARAAVAARAACRDYCLIVNDWSPLHYTRHHSKKDRIVLCSKDDFGYMLQSELLLSDKDGSPLAPLYLGLEAADGVHSTRRVRPLPRRAPLDELHRTFNYVTQLGLPKPCGQIVDRQGDAILHMRRFARCQHLFLLRGNDLRRVVHEGQSRRLPEVEATLAEQFRYVRRVQYKGRRAWQYVAETPVTLTGAARLKRHDQAGQTYRRIVPGKALTLRYVVAQVRDKRGRVLATWRLWSNLPERVSAATVALWYYWRWQGESFFKLLKRAGQHAEQWQQEKVAAIAKRLLVAAQACLIVWALQHAEDEESVQLRHFLIRLSGRLLKRGVASTAPALFAGMWHLLAIIDALERYELFELQQNAAVLLQMLGLEQDYEFVKELV